MFFSRALLFGAFIGSALAEWPEFENGACTIKKFYCSEHLRDADFKGEWKDRKDPRIIWGCKEGEDGKGVLEIAKICPADQYCAMNFGGLGHYGGCWAIEEWEDFTFMMVAPNPDWKEEWRKEADMLDD